MLFVGPVRNYPANRIPEALLAGPAAAPEGLARLKQAVDKAPQDTEVVVYCGFCAWDKCPNVRPAYRTLTHVKVVMIQTTFNEDWVS